MSEHNWGAENLHYAQHTGWKIACKSAWVRISKNAEGSGAWDFICLALFGRLLFAVRGSRCRPWNWTGDGALPWASLLIPWPPSHPAGRILLWSPALNLPGPPDPQSPKPEGRLGSTPCKIIAGHPVLLEVCFLRGLQEARKSLFVFIKPLIDDAKKQTCVQQVRVKFNGFRTGFAPGIAPEKQRILACPTGAARIQGKQRAATPHPAMHAATKPRGIPPAPAPEATPQRRFSSGTGKLHRAVSQSHSPPTALPGWK